MDNKKKMFIIIIVIIVLLIAIFAIIYKKFYPKNARGNNVIKEDTYDMYEAYKNKKASEGATANDAVATLENNANKYFTVKSIIDNFNTYVSYLNTSVSKLGLIVPAGKEDEALQKYKQTGLNYINSMLANNYKVKFSADDNYIYNILKNYSGKSYNITDMYVLEDSAYINTYFVYGNYEGNEFNYIVILDKYNYTFEIYLNNYFAEKGYSKKDISTMKTLNIEKIEKNNYNGFEYKSINEEQMAKQYYEDFFSKMKNNVQMAYNLLDSEYKEKRFGSIDNFKVYINNVVNTNVQRSLVSYSTTKYNNYTEHICQDNFGNNFIFKSTGVMKYTVILDTYTVAVNSYDKEYNDADGAKKAQLCLNRFFEALNNKDYETAYNFFNSTYRETNFKTVDEFKNYVQKNWFEINSFSYSNVSLNGDYYYLSGQISNYKIEGSFDAKQVSKTFIVSLGKNIRDFQISFSK